MTRAQFAEAIGVPEKWVHNAGVALGKPLRYTPTVARRLFIARVIQTTVPVALPVADQLAGAALAPHAGLAPVVARSPDGAVSVTVELLPLLSVFAVQLARALHRTPRRPGRRQAPTRRGKRLDARARADAYGIDLSLIDGNLRRTPDERLRALDANAAFVGALRSRRAAL